MQTPDLLEEIAQTRAKPLQIECQRPDGSRTMCSVELLDRTLNGTRARRRR